MCQSVISECQCILIVQRVRTCTLPDAKNQKTPFRSMWPQKWGNAFLILCSSTRPRGKGTINKLHPRAARIYHHWTICSIAPKSERIRRMTNVEWSQTLLPNARGPYLSPSQRAIAAWRQNTYLCFVKTGRLVSHLYLCSCFCKAWEDRTLEIFPFSLVIPDSIQRWKYSCERGGLVANSPGRAGKQFEQHVQKWPSKFTVSFVFLTIRVQFG